MKNYLKETYGFNEIESVKIAEEYDRLKSHSRFIHIDDLVRYILFKKKQK